MSERNLTDTFTDADAAEVKRRLADEVTVFCEEVLQPAVARAVDTLQRDGEPKLLRYIALAVQAELEQMKLGPMFYAQMAMVVGDAVADMCYPEGNEDGGLSNGSAD